MSQSPPFVSDADKTKIRERHLAQVEAIAYATGMMNTFFREAAVIEQTLEKLAGHLEKSGIPIYSNKHQYLYKAIDNARVSAKGLSLDLGCAIDEANKVQKGGEA